LIFWYNLKQQHHTLTITFFISGRPGSKGKEVKETEDKNFCGQKDPEQKCEDKHKDSV